MKSIITINLIKNIISRKEKKKKLKKTNTRTLFDNNLVFDFLFFKI